MSNYKPSDFVKLGHPSCSVWGKAEIESLAEAYVLALAVDGDTWKRLTKSRVLELLSDEQQGFARNLLCFDFYDRWFEMVADRITDSDGALSVRGFWSEYRFAMEASAASQQEES